jgi:hypothetical protein
MRRSTVGDVILSVTYGISPASERDAFIQLAEDAVGAIAEVALGGYIGQSILRFWPHDMLILTTWIHFKKLTYTHR